MTTYRYYSATDKEPIAVATTQDACYTGQSYDDLSVSSVEFKEAPSLDVADFEPGQGPVRVRPTMPNPFQGRTVLSFDLAEELPVRVAVFDLSGRHVRTLLDASLSRGRHSTLWDGRDSAGRPVVPGIYLGRVESRGHVQNVRMTLLK